MIGSLTEGVGRQSTTFTIDAFSGPAGEQPGGTVLVRSLLLDADLTVSCLQVNGTRAVVGARQDISIGVLQYYLVIVDRPAGEQDLILARRYIADPAAPATCAAADPDGAIPDPARLGSVVVTDATPLPTTRAQCKHGGWAPYDFKNQGQCVRFVRLLPGAVYPSTKEQCRHGGWAQYGFKNKRRCLRFVRLTPKP